MAKSRYGWQKRAKELARKQKNEEKMKRRQNKGQERPESDLLEPETAEQDTETEGNASLAE